MRMTRALFIVVLTVALTGCGAMWLQMRYGTLSSETRMSESVFLELRSELPPTVYVSETNATAHPIAVQDALEDALAWSGYTLVGDPVEATYIVQVNHRQFLETELGDQTLDDALGSALTAAYAGGLTAGMLGAEWEGAVAVGLAFGVVGFVADANTKHLAHVLTTDLRLTEVVARSATSTVVSRGWTAARAPSLEEYQHETLIASGASKVNLRTEESLPAIVNALAESLARILPERIPQAQ